MGRAVLALSFLVGLAFAALTVGSALADTTVGQVGAPTNLFAFYAGGDEIVDTSYVVPAGGGTITGFHTQSSSACQFSFGVVHGIYDFQVLRPQGGNQYLVVGHTGNHTDPCDSQLHSFAVNIPAQAGDVLGAYVVTTWVGVLLASGGQFFGFQSQPTVGQTVIIPTADIRFVGLDESATLSNVNDELTNLLGAVTGVGPGTSLADKVTAVQGYLASNDTADACGTLGAFTHEVYAQSGRHIDPTLAESLVNQAGNIQAVLGCTN
jgi:hypothetical protein